MTEIKQRHLHVDADVLLYKVGFAGDKDGTDLPLQKARLGEKVSKIMHQASTTKDTTFLHLSSKENFRDEIATYQPYKGNRKEARKPQFFYELREWLTNTFNTIEEYGMEADDSVGMCCSGPNDPIETVLWSEDKDLKMIPCTYMDTKTGNIETRSLRTADSMFIEQLLTGDSSDNIPGLYKFTGRKATARWKRMARAADGNVYFYPDKDRFKLQWDTVFDIYMDALAQRDGPPENEEEEKERAENVFHYLTEIGHLLWIKRYDCRSWIERYAQSKASGEETHAEVEEVPF